MPQNLKYIIKIHIIASLLEMCVNAKAVSEFTLLFGDADSIKQKCICCSFFHSFYLYHFIVYFLS